MGFSEFRDLMDIADEFMLESEIETKINSLVDGQGCIMFFKKEDNVFGCTEEGRVVFARMKNPDDDLPKGWTDEASFSVYNLNKMVRGESGERVLKKDDLDSIKVIERDEVVEELKKEAEKAGDKAFSKQGGLRLLQFKLPSMSRKDEE